MYRAFYQERTVTGPAPLTRRLAAMVYDFLLVLAIYMVVSIVAVVINDGEAVTGPLYESMLFLLAFMFFAYFWTRSGQTLGMTAWRLRVQSVDGGRISWMQALTRFMIAIPSFLLCAAGFFWQFIDPEKLTWYERLSGTRTVELAPENKKNRK